MKEITEQDLLKMGIKKREAIRGFLKKCEKNKIDYRQYNVLNLGKHRIRSLSWELFGKPRQCPQDDGYSPIDKGNETRRKNLLLIRSKMRKHNEK